MGGGEKVKGGEKSEKQKYRKGEERKRERGEA